MTVPVQCVVDTNVPATADGKQPKAGPECVLACQRALAAIRAGGRVFIDDSFLILKEYLGAVGSSDQSPGKAFVRWVLTNQTNPARVTRVRITPKAHDQTDFHELPPPLPKVKYDPSDRKFLAVAVAHPERPPILGGLDHKWLAWPPSLARHEVVIYFVCPADVKAIEANKAKKR